MFVGGTASVRGPTALTVSAHRDYVCHDAHAKPVAMCITDVFNQVALLSLLLHRNQHKLPNMYRMFSFFLPSNLIGGSIGASLCGIHNNLLHNNPHIARRKTNLKKPRSDLLSLRPQIDTQNHHIVVES